MRRILVATVALSLAVLVMPGAAHADSPDVIFGGCGYTSQADPSDASTQIAVWDESSVTTDRDGVPVDATVTCWAEIYGVEVPGSRFSYSGFAVQAGVDRFSYTASDLGWAYPCEQVTFADGTTQLWNCGEGPFYFPPRPVDDALYVADNAITAAYMSVIDPAVCPALVRAAGTYGPVTIEPDGDVDVPDPLDLWVGQFYDCPPYGDF
jgi:hypothetical protein